MNLWRIHLKPSSAVGLDVREYCVTNSIVGFGWPISTVGNIVTPDFYYTEAQETYSSLNDKSWFVTWNAFYNKMQIGDLVWTRTYDGNYYLGRVVSDWKYDSSDIASKMDMCNVRSCDWLKIGLVSDVPGKVVSSFIPSRTLQRIQDQLALEYSKQLYNQLSDKPSYHHANFDGYDLFSLLSAEDCEDVVGLYLQIVYGLYIIPSSCKSDTLGYEYELIDPQTGIRAVVQVKSGTKNLDRNEFRRIEGRVFLFTTQGEYLGNESDQIICLQPDGLKAFMFEYRDLLPQKIQFWLEVFLNNLQQIQH